jgi:hypothetical protein
VHQALLDTPVLSEVFCAVDPAMSLGRITTHTALVIDGYPRSGNSYARATFQYANGDDLPISTHAHSHRMPERAVRLGIPAIVLIREPRDAIDSGRHFEPSVPVAHQVTAYRRYYEPMLKIIDHVVIATFDEITDDPGTVTERCNARFGTDFVPYRRTPEAEAACAAVIDAATAMVAAPERFAATVSRPSSVRAAQELPELARRDMGDLARLEDLYAAVLAARTG